MYQHLLECPVSNWSVPERPCIFSGGVSVEHVVAVITDPAVCADARVTVHADTNNPQILTQRRSGCLSTDGKVLLVLFCRDVTLVINGMAWEY